MQALMMAVVEHQELTIARTEEKRAAAKLEVCGVVWCEIPKAGSLYHRSDTDRHRHRHTDTDTNMTHTHTHTHNVTRHCAHQAAEVLVRLVAVEGAYDVLRSEFKNESLLDIGTRATLRQRLRELEEE